MTFDLAQHIVACLFWLVVGIFVGWLLTWAVMTQNPAVLGWVHYHLPWLYSLLHQEFTCPATYVCQLAN